MALEFTLNQGAAATADVDCVVVGAYADKTLTPSAQAINGSSGGRLSALLQRGDVGGKAGNTTLLHDLSRSARSLTLYPFQYAGAANHG